MLFLRIAFIASFGLSFILCDAQTANFDWVQILGTPDQTGDKLEIDSQGNIITGGLYINTVDFDPGPGVFSIGSNGGHDVYVQKLDANGNFLWAVGFGGTKYESLEDLKVDKYGNTYLIGYFQDSVDLDPGIPIKMHYCNGIYNTYIMKLNPSGNLLWSHTFGGTAADIGRVIEFTNDQKIIVGGRITSTTDFDPGPGTAIHTPDSVDGFLVKYDTAGNFLWVKMFENGGHFEFMSIDIDDNDNIYTAGYYNDTVDFDPGLGTYHVIDTGYGAMFILKLNSNGDFVWVKSLRSSNYMTNTCIHRDRFGNLYVGGDFDDNVDFDPGTNTFWKFSFVSSIYILNLDTNGVFQWVKTIGGTFGFLPDIPYSIETDYQGNIFVAGAFQGQEDFDPNAGVFMLSGSQFHSFWDAFVMELDSAGNLQWAKAIGNESPTKFNDIERNALGDIFLTGFFSDTVDFDPDFGLANRYGIGTLCQFVLKLKSCANQSIDEINACGSYNWIDGKTYTNNNNTATHTLQNAQFCDSTIQLNLTVTSIDTSVSITNDTLMATPNATSYQWVDCNNNYSAIPGATLQNFVPAVNGTYAVLISSDTCSDTSACIPMVVLGTKDKFLVDIIKVYPNPASTIIHFDLLGENKLDKPFALFLYDVNGKVVYAGKAFQEGPISVERLAKGLYFYHLTGKDERYVGKFVVE